MSTHPTNSTQSSSLADKQTNMFTLPPPEDLTEGSEVYRDVCKNSCIQSDGGCTGILNTEAARDQARLREGEDLVSLILPLTKVARAMWLDQNPSKEDQSNATNAFIRNVSSMHRVRSDGANLGNQDKSVALTNWVEEYEELYGRMHKEASNPGPLAKKDRAMMKSLRNSEASASEDGHRDMADKFGGHADKLESKLERKATEFATKWTVDLWDHFKSFQDHQTIQLPDVSLGVGDTEGSQSLGQPRGISRLGIAEAKPN